LCHISLWLLALLWADASVLLPTLRILRKDLVQDKVPVVFSYSYFFSALDWGEWSALHPGRALLLGKGPPVPIEQEAEGWVDPRAGLDAETRRKILCLCRESNPGRPVRSQSLY
jgi:hypothetical protein